MYAIWFNPCTHNYEVFQTVCEIKCFYVFLLIKRLHFFFLNQKQLRFLFTCNYESFFFFHFTVKSYYYTPKAELPGTEYRFPTLSEQMLRKILKVFHIRSFIIQKIGYISCFHINRAQKTFLLLFLSHLFQNTRANACIT